MFPLSLLECLGLSETRSEDRKSVEKKVQTIFFGSFIHGITKKVVSKLVYENAAKPEYGVWKEGPDPALLSVSHENPERFPHPVPKFWRIPLPGWQ